MAMNDKPTPNKNATADKSVSNPDGTAVGAFKAMLKQQAAVDKQAKELTKTVATVKTAPGYGQKHIPSKAGQKAHAAHVTRELKKNK